MEKQQVVGSSLIFFVQTPLGEIGGHYNQGPIKQTTFFFLIFDFLYFIIMEKCEIHILIIYSYNKLQIEKKIIQ